MPFLVIALLLDMTILMICAFWGPSIKSLIGEDAFVVTYAVALLSPVGILAMMGSIPVVRVADLHELKQPNKKEDK